MAVATVTDGGDGGERGGTVRAQVAKERRADRWDKRAGANWMAVADRTEREAMRKQMGAGGGEGKEGGWSRRGGRSGEGQPKQLVMD